MAITWAERRRLGDRHEQDVAERLTERGWRVTNCGIEHLRAMHKALLTATDSPHRYMPDLLVSPADRPHTGAYIDCKAQFSPDAEHRFISAACVLAQMGLNLKASIWYVFSDFSVSDPWAVHHTGTLTGRNGDLYYKVPRDLDRSFDSVFPHLAASPHLVMSMPEAA